MDNYRWPHARDAYNRPDDTGWFPQARVVTLVTCGIRRVLGAEVDSSAVSEEVLRDRRAG